DVAEALDGEVISADSRQVYRGLDVGTAKPTPAERARAPHHGLDLVDPDVRYSAGRFARDAVRWIDEIAGRGRVPVVVGGTGFFIRALTDPLFREPPMERSRRERLREVLDGLEPERLRRWLERLDAESAGTLRERGEAQRVLRALEVVLLTGRTLPWWQRHQPPTTPPLEGPIFVLDLPRDQLYHRIDRRVDAMLEAGLVNEVARLLEAGYGPGAPGMNATGYPEIAAHLRGELDLDEAAERIRRRTRGYARRQLTWFRNQLPERATWLDGTRPEGELVEEMVGAWRAA
ncbi:MAG: tRNA (adenosine(37)-N6)-dimethylallyltransferase MiaA, partial [Gemmatimonadota bacterium]